MKDGLWILQLMPGTPAVTNWCSWVAVAWTALNKSGTIPCTVLDVCQGPTILSANLDTKLLQLLTPHLLQ